ncbi:hypothetical protein RRG08_054177 [Elysia crispata]|uniref:Uncharacterized protein n=1 Tax=Elysia crispata TaxID=231223 RepID=A0AAE1DR81_9GAST|nr:hypothetical protein RRG08_054177 [Elysia crispata]
MLSPSSSSPSPRGQFSWSSRDAGGVVGTMGDEIPGYGTVCALMILFLLPCMLPADYFFSTSPPNLSCSNLLTLTHSLTRKQELKKGPFLRPEALIGVSIHASLAGGPVSYHTTNSSNFCSFEAVLFSAGASILLAYSHSALRPKHMPATPAFQCAGTSNPLSHYYYTVSENLAALLNAVSAHTPTLVGSVLSQNILGRRPAGWLDVSSGWPRPPTRCLSDSERFVEGEISILPVGSSLPNTVSLFWCVYGVSFSQQHTAVRVCVWDIFFPTPYCCWGVRMGLWDLLSPTPYCCWGVRMGLWDLLSPTPYCCWGVTLISSPTTWLDRGGSFSCNFLLYRRVSFSLFNSESELVAISFFLSPGNTALLQYTFCCIVMEITSVIGFSFFCVAPRYMMELVHGEMVPTIRVKSTIVSHLSRDAVKLDVTEGDCDLAD